MANYIMSCIMVGQILCVQNILVLGQLGPMLFCPKMVVNHILGTIFGSVFHFWNTYWLFEEPLRIFLRGQLENHKWVFHFLECADKCIKLTCVFFFFPTDAVDKDYQPPEFYRDGNTFKVGTFITSFMQRKLGLIVL